MTKRELGLCAVGGMLVGLGAALILAEHAAAACRRRVEGMMTR